MYFYRNNLCILLSMYFCLCSLIVRPCILNVVYVFLLFVHVFLTLSMYSYYCLCISLLSMYSYCCLCILIFRPYILNVVYVFLFFVHVFLTLSMYSYYCLCISLLSMYSYFSSIYS